MWKHGWIVFVFLLSSAPVCSLDTDGDGVSDFQDICPTIPNPDQAPEACVPFSGEYPIDRPAATEFLGEGIQNLAGSALSGAGDVDGDGLSDFLIGAHYNDEGGEMAGKVYLYLGRREGYGETVLLSEAEISFVGEAPFDCAGIALSGAGDVDGDGLSDFLIGAYLNDEAGFDAGKAYLLFGKERGWAAGFPLAQAPLQFLGEHSGDGAGITLSGGGDFNGDGLADFAIGAPANGDAGPLAGRVYLFFGRSRPWDGVFSLAEADVIITGEAAGDRAGSALSLSHDLDGDGFSDLVIGAPGAGSAGNQTGKVYLLFGGTTVSNARISLSEVTTTIAGAHPFDQAGAFLATSPDLDGDRFADLLVAAPGSDGSAPDGGAIFLLSGGRRDFPATLGESDAEFPGEAGYDQSGRVAAVGDLDRDGRADFLVGTPPNDSGGHYAGKAHLLLGRPFSGTYPLQSASAAFVGEHPADEAGYALAGAGDVNGDGFADFLIGAIGNDEAAEMAGKAYLFYGRN
ncbi:MAG: hypothetical protein D6812_11455 [Deltaproteobacteria bacterium]|nr:MAG: hypothetical protein D6812_11455 [Deltaproteobacteria bacterium]